MRRIAVNGVHLNVEISGDGPALLLLHGFTGSSSTWAAHLDTWQGFRTIAVDLLGHGSSDCPANPSRYSFQHAVSDLVRLLDSIGVSHSAVLGYSMGGRIALHLALHLSLHAPARLCALVLESASPGIEDPSERHARARSDATLATTIERDGVESFVEQWEAGQLFATQAHLPDPVRESLRSQRLANSPRGLANSLRAMSVGVQEPLLARLGAIDAPVLILAGALDEKYQTLAQQMAERLPRARMETVAAVGHAIHLEQPLIFGRLVRDFLREQPLGN